MDIEAEFGLPLASITRIVKSRLPEGIQVGKEAKLAFSKASGIFVLYLVSCALDICKESKRSTIFGDIFAALEEVEFDDYKEPLRDYLNKYREQQDAKKAEKELQIAKAAAAATQENSNNNNNSTDDISKKETSAMDTSE